MWNQCNILLNLSYKKNKKWISFFLKNVYNYNIFFNCVVYKFKNCNRFFQKLGYFFESWFFYAPFWKIMNLFFWNTLSKISMSFKKYKLIKVFSFQVKCMISTNAWIACLEKKFFRPFICFLNLKIEQFNGLIRTIGEFNHENDYVSKSKNSF